MRLEGEREGRGLKKVQAVFQTDPKLIRKKKLFSGGVSYQ